jgi:hypothetical protein
MSSIIRATTSSGLQVAPDNSGSLQLQTNGTTTAVTIDTSQNVGIGTTTINGAGKTLAIQGAVSSIVASSTSYANFVSLYSGQTSDPNPTVIFNNSLRFGTATSPDGIGYVERMRIDSSGNLLFNSGYGSVETAYGCRAWISFNGTGTIAIRGSGNVSSIADGGTGLYTVNFSTAMPDANYSSVMGGNRDGTTTDGFRTTYSQSTSSVLVRTLTTGTTTADHQLINIAILR